MNYRKTVARVMAMILAVSLLPIMPIVTVAEAAYKALAETKMVEASIGVRDQTYDNVASVYESVYYSDTSFEKFVQCQSSDGEKWIYKSLDTGKEYEYRWEDDKEIIEGNLTLSWEPSYLTRADDAKISKVTNYYRHITGFSASGLAAAQAMDGSWVSLNAKGEIAARFPKDFQPNGVEEPSDDGYCVAYTYGDDNTTYFIMNLSTGGQTTLSFHPQGQYNNGLIPMQTDDGIQYADINGKAAFSEKFWQAGDFSEGYAIVQDKEDKWRVIDKNGKTMVTAEAGVSFDDDDTVSLNRFPQYREQKTSEGYTDHYDVELYDLSSKKAVKTQVEVSGPWSLRYENGYLRYNYKSTVSDPQGSFTLEASDDDYGFYFSEVSSTGYVWGYNGSGKLATWKLNGNNTPTNPQVPAESEYIYDTEDPGESVVLDAERLKGVADTPAAAAAVRDQVKSMTSVQKASATGTDLATLYAETAASKVASKTVSGNEIVINKAAATELTANSNEALKAVETELASGGITTARELSCTVTFRTSATGEITVRVEPDVLTAEVDRFIVETPTYALTLRVADLKDALGSGTVVIRAQDVGSYTMVSHSMILASAGGSIPMAGGMTVYESPVTQNTVYAAANGTTQVKLTLPAGFSEPVTLSMPGSAAQDTVKDSTGAATPSKYNPATARVDSWVNASGTYAAQSNEKDFVDIANKSAEMQRAIRYLASRGIINGTDETHFNPDGSITRAEIAALLVRALGRLDKNAKPTFTDVKTSNWYYATAASSQKAGLIKGYEDNTFRGGNQINKEQIVAVSARVLTKEMGYKTPSNTASYLKKYSDSVVEWARPEVALATKENLVVYRKDGTFRGGAGMTRGDAAIIIYRVFMKIW